MAPGLIFPGVCRYTVHGTFAGEQIANILDMDIDSVGVGGSRNAHVLDQAHVIVSAWIDNVCPAVSSHYLGTSVSWVDMDSSSGTTGEVSDGTGTDFPSAGGESNAPASGNNAYLIHKQVTALRGARAGRMFLVGVTESRTGADTPNDVDGSWVAAINGRMADFLAAINQDAGIGPSGYDSRLVVCHTTNAGTPTDPIIHANGHSDVSSLVCDAKIHSQRRRLG